MKANFTFESKERNIAFRDLNKKTSVRCISTHSQTKLQQIQTKIFWHIFSVSNQDPGSDAWINISHPQAPQGKIIAGKQYSWIHIRIRLCRAFMSFHYIEKVRSRIDLESLLINRAVLGAVMFASICLCAWIKTLFLRSSWKSFVKRIDDYICYINKLEL